MRKGKVTASRPNVAPVIIHPATTARFLHFNADGRGSGDFTSVAMMLRYAQNSIPNQDRGTSDGIFLVNFWRANRGAVVRSSVDVRKASCHVSFLVVQRLVSEAVTGYAGSSFLCPR